MTVDHTIIDGMTIQVDGCGPEVAVELSVATLAPDLHLLHLLLADLDPSRAGAVRLLVRMPALDVPFVFIPHLSTGQAVWPDYEGNGHVSRGCIQVPLQAVYGADGGNRCTVALAEVAHPVRIGVGIEEEGCDLIVRVRPFEGGRAAGTPLRATLRLDRRALPWYEAVREAVAWWDELAAAPALPVPSLGREPMYSTWYAFHLAMEPELLLEQCRLARALGCRAVIIDDGWQTADASRDYRRSGDWLPERFADMAALSERIHALGMGLLLWYGLPHAGHDTATYRRFAAELLNDDPDKGLGLLDPRSAEVRAHLAGLLARQVAAWHLDGLKLDFVSSFLQAAPERSGPPGELDGAVALLLDEIQTALQEVRPDILIEYRQPYLGPGMRRTGNLFRAVDCPNDLLRNRARILSLRLLVAGSAVHADMLLWHARSNAEVAALQLLAVLFSVPQLSVRLDLLPERHSAMLRFWLAWWREHRDCLLDGALRPESPEQGWPLVSAEGSGERIIVVYADRTIRLGPDLPATCWIVNATALTDLALVVAEGLGPLRWTSRDCTGQETGAGFCPDGPQQLAIPLSGLACLRRVAGPAFPMER